MVQQGTIVALGDTQLRLTHLASNRLSGSLPQDLLGLSSLDHFNSHLNKLSGTLPALYSERLFSVVASHNMISGSCPDTFNTSKLKYLTLSSNMLSGPLPFSIANSSTLKALIMHSNRLDSSVPSFENLISCENLTLFDNSFTGSLKLPFNTSLKVLFAHANRLSCEIQENDVRVSQHNLILPGNVFTEPVSRALADPRIFS